MRYDKNWQTPKNIFGAHVPAVHWGRIGAQATRIAPILDKNLRRRHELLKVAQVLEVGCVCGGLFVIAEFFARAPSHVYGVAVRKTEIATSAMAVGREI